MARPSWPPLKSHIGGVQADYGKAMIARLSESQRDLLEKEVANYLAHRWWERSPPPDAAGSTPSTDPSIIVFPLQQSLLKSTKLRPVCDARMWNNLLPQASYLGSDTTVLLTEMQLAVNKLLLDGYPMSEIAIGYLDVNRAFYRIHLDAGWKLRLSLGGTEYISRRLIFGLAVGPSALESFMRRLIDLMYARGVSHRVHVFIYLDDVCVIGPRDEVCFAIQTLRRLGTLHGFPFPEEKSHILTIGSSEIVRHLGVYWKVSEGHFAIQCPTVEVPSEPAPSYTKRQLFGFSGKLCDPLRRHPLWRYSADVIRAFCGRWSTGWDKPHLLSVSEKQTLSTIINKIRDINSNHVHMLDDIGKGHLVIRGDASSDGYGWLVFLSDSVNDVADISAPLFCRARLWRTSQQYWHINRRELFCSVEALLCVGDLRLKEFGIETVLLETDSRVTCGWLRGASFRAVTKSQERTSIGRLLVIASDVRVRLQLPIIVRHIVAALNSSADELSRLAQLWNLPLDDLFNKSRSGGDSSVHKVCLIRCAAVLTASIEILAEMQHDFAETMALILHCRASEAVGYYDCGLGRFRLEQRNGREVLTRVTMTVGTPYTEGRSVLVHPWDDREKTDSIIVKCHEEIGHLSAPMTLWHLRRFWWWKGIRTDTKRVCMLCDHCISAVIKGSMHVWKGNCLDHSVRSPWETVSADLAGPFTADSFNCIYCLILCDHFSRFCLLRPLRSATSREVIRAITEICGTFGSMRVLRCDRGTCFASRMTQSSLQALGIHVRLIVPRAPRCNGLVER